jgi:hypothetical protein
MPHLPLDTGSDGDRDDERRNGLRDDERHAGITTAALTGRGSRPVAAFAFALTLLAAAVLANGAWIAWTQHNDGDMLQRAEEYDSFRRGIYPNRAIEGPATPRGTPYSVYPPYALPMFAVFFEPGGWLQGRIVLQGLSLAALVVMGRYGWRILRLHGGDAAWAAVGGVAGAAIAGNCSALARGQFSIICVGLIVAQIVLLERGKGAAAGLCWSLAMLKPQIALPFALLFAVDSRWRGLIVGAAVLAGLGLLACWWTDVSPLTVARHWLFDMPLRFTESANSVGPAAISRWLGISPRIGQFLALAGLVLTLATIAVLGRGRAVDWLTRPATDAAAAPAVRDMLPVAAICSLLGELFMYHHHYDNVMLFPTVLCLLAMAGEAPSWHTIAAAAVMGSTVWLPQSVFDAFPVLAVLRAVVWAVSCVALVVHVTRRRYVVT